MVSPLQKPLVVRTVRGLTFLALAVVVALACRADEGLVGPVKLQVAPVDSILEPGQPLRLTGIDLVGVKVRIGGLDARTIRSSSASLEITIPDSLFAPCLRSGVRYEIEVRRGRQLTFFSKHA
jgi:hypothetical protein